MGTGEFLEVKCLHFFFFFLLIRQLYDQDCKLLIENININIYIFTECKNCTFEES